MKKVEICMGRDCREFEILARKELEEKINGLCFSEVYEKAFEKASGYHHSGTAFCYIDARDGSLQTIWLSSNTYEHPFDSFYEVVLCSIRTGDGFVDLDDPELLLNDDEWEEYWASSLGPSEFIVKKYGEEELEDRKDTAIQWLAMEFEFDDDEIERQLDELYREPVSELPFFEV